jgi:hypothetical protein
MDLLEPSAGHFLVKRPTLYLSAWAVTYIDRPVEKACDQSPRHLKVIVCA